MNLRRVLGTVGAVLLVLGGLDLAAGFGSSLLARRAAPAVAPVTPTAAATMRSASNDIVALAFYTQNRHFRLAPHFDFERLPRPAGRPAFSFAGGPRWVERGVLAFDHDPGTCYNEVGRKLHVFSIEAQARQFFAIGFFFWQDRHARPGAGPSHTQITCLPTSDLRVVRYHPDTFGPFDVIVRRSRLEFAAHTELRDLPQATYPAHDKTMLPVAMHP